MFVQILSNQPAVILPLWEEKKLAMKKIALKYKYPHLKRNRNEYWWGYSHSEWFTGFGGKLMWTLYKNKKLILGFVTKQSWVRTAVLELTSCVVRWDNVWDCISTTPYTELRKYQLSIIKNTGGVWWRSSVSFWTNETSKATQHREVSRK